MSEERATMSAEQATMTSPALPSHSVQSARRRYTVCTCCAARHLRSVFTKIPAIQSALIESSRTRYSLNGCLPP